MSKANLLDNECYANHQLAEHLGLGFWIYPYRDHYLLRVWNSVRRATTREVELWERLRLLYEALPHDPACPACRGEGEYFSHAADCDNDFCALAGGPDDCDGAVVKCDCKTPIGPVEYS